ncbi:MAG: hypothetical protein O2799_00980 [Planctomycetota bacterium]|nr:hypothetical protein [Planctomycetota bacterium]
MRRLLGRIWGAGSSTRGARGAARRVAEDPSAQNYLALAQESVQRGEPARVEAVCHEALALHPDHPALKSMLARATRMRLDERARQLQAELAEAPRPALWRELVEIELGAGRFGRAEALAARWQETAPSAQAQAHRARAALHTFRESALPADAQRAWDLAGLAAEESRGDGMAHEVCAELARMVGAHAAERAALARLIEAQPGQPELEARYREALACVGGPASFSAALEAVTRGGVVTPLSSSYSQEREVEAATLAGVRPRLKELLAGSQAAFASFHRGGTALVQGATGPTADRTARGVRDLVRAGRDGARRLGLGPVRGIRVLGAHGDLAVRSSSRTAAAAWGREPLGSRELTELEALVEQEVWS